MNLLVIIIVLAAILLLAAAILRGLHQIHRQRYIDAIVKLGYQGQRPDLRLDVNTLASETHRSPRLVRGFLLWEAWRNRMTNTGGAKNFLVNGHNMLYYRNQQRRRAGYGEALA